MKFEILSYHKVTKDEKTKFSENFYKPVYMEISGAE